MLLLFHFDILSIITRLTAAFRRTSKILRDLRLKGCNERLGQLIGVKSLPAAPHLVTHSEAATNLSSLNTTNKKTTRRLVLATFNEYLTYSIALFTNRNLHSFVVNINPLTKSATIQPTRPCIPLPISRKPTDNAHSSRSGHSVARYS